MTQARKTEHELSILFGLYSRIMYFPSKELQSLRIAKNGDIHIFLDNKKISNLNAIEAFMIIFPYFNRVRLLEAV